MRELTTQEFRRALELAQAGEAHLTPGQRLTALKLAAQTGAMPQREIRRELLRLLGQPHKASDATLRSLEKARAARAAKRAKSEVRELDGLQDHLDPCKVGPLLSPCSVPIA